MQICEIDQALETRLMGASSVKLTAPLTILLLGGWVTKHGSKIDGIQNTREIRMSYIRRQKP